MEAPPGDGARLWRYVACPCAGFLIWIKGRHPVCRKNTGIPAEY
jgi:hypothetical protein